MSKATSHPFLIEKIEVGCYRLTVRETRYNSQGYPLITAHRQAEVFASANAARAFARENFRAEAGQFTTK